LVLQNNWTLGDPLRSLYPALQLQTGSAPTEGVAGSIKYKGATKDHASTRKENSAAVSTSREAEQAPEKYWVSERSYGGFF
jgi:hypothetical protein